MLFILGTTGTDPSTSSFCAHLEPTHAAAAGCDLGLNVVTLASPSYHSIQDDSNLKLGELGMIWIVPTLGTNLLSTGLIAWKFW